MHGIWKAIGSFVRRADMILLSLCIAASVYGIVIISSATNVKGSTQYVRTQILALILGIILYVVFTLIDVDIIAERRELLLIFSAIPLSAIGGILSLWMRDMNFSISAGVGFIALFGVAVLNGIVLVAEFNRQKQTHSDLREVVKIGFYEE